jgi:2'-5' RNA ligase
VDVEDPELLAVLEDVQRRLEETDADLKRVEGENIHVTMWFLGDVRMGSLQELQGLVSGIEFKPFRAELKGLGAFPNLSRPRVVWVGISDGVEELTEIFESLEPKIVGLGFRADDRGFSPHITLARVRSGKNRDRLVEEISARADTVFGDMTVKCIRLKKSILTPKGPVYSTIAESKV